MRSLMFCLAFIAAACGAPPSQDSPAPAAIAVTEAWGPPSPGGVDVSAGYLTIANAGAEADTLLSITSPRAGRVEIHTMAMDGAVMQMRMLDALPIPAGGQTDFAQSGDHLMFFDVREPFVAGEEIPLRLTFERAGEVDAQLRIRTGGH